MSHWHPPPLRCLQQGLALPVPSFGLPDLLASCTRSRQQDKLCSFCCIALRNTSPKQIFLKKKKHVPARSSLLCALRTVAQWDRWCPLTLSDDASDAALPKASQALAHAPTVLSVNASTPLHAAATAAVSLR